MAKCMLIREDYETFNPQSKILKKAEYQKPPPVQLKYVYYTRLISSQKTFIYILEQLTQVEPISLLSNITPFRHHFL